MMWLLHVLGLDNLSGPWYGFWSGFGADISEAAVVGTMITLVRHHTCEVHRCWRLGRHATAAGHRVCRKHHPEDKLTGASVASAHRATLES